MLYFAGFKSRVKYINVLDPSTFCYYVSEILDAGREEPLFMVNFVTSIYSFNFVKLFPFFVSCFTSSFCYNYLGRNWQEHIP